MCYCSKKQIQRCVTPFFLHKNGAPQPHTVLCWEGKQIFIYNNLDGCSSSGNSEEVIIMTQVVVSIIVVVIVVVVVVVCLPVCVCVCVRERESVCVCVCVCVITIRL